MNEQTPQDLLNAMNALLAKASATTTTATGWTQPQAAAPAAIQGVGVPVKISRGRGTIKIMLWLPAECASSPSALNNTLDQLESAGLPLDVWEPKDSGWGGNSYGNRGWRK